jgi:hypothetical protein
MIKFPYLNPVKFVRATNAADLFFNNSIPSFETQTNYFQKFEQADTIKFQIIFDSSIINKYGMIVQLKGCDDGFTYGTFITDGDPFVYDGYLSLTYKLNLYLPVIPEGYYYVYIYAPFRVGSNFELFYSEPLHIAATHSNTVLLKYTNDGNDFDVFFYKTHSYNSYHVFQYRVDGGFKSDGWSPGSVDNLYIDQTHSPVMLSSTPFESRVLTIGDNYGIPNYQAGVINRILSCTSVWIDSVLYCKADGAKMEPIKIATNHPLFAWTIEVMKSDNDYSREHKIKRIASVGIGTAAIGSTFIIGGNKTMTTVATPTTTGLIITGPPVAVPALTAGVETEVFHATNTNYVMWRFRDVTGRTLPQFSIEEKSTTNPKTAVTIRSEVDIAAGTLVMDYIGWN